MQSKPELISHVVPPRQAASPSRDKIADFRTQAQEPGEPEVDSAAEIGGNRRARVLVALHNLRSDDPDFLMTDGRAHPCGNI